MDLVLFLIIFSTLLQIIKIVVETIGLKTTVNDPNCPNEVKAVKSNNIGLNICKYGSLLLNVIAIIVLICTIVSC